MKLEILDFFCISPLFSFFFSKMILDNALKFNAFQLLHFREKKCKKTLLYISHTCLKLFLFLVCLFFVDFISLQDYFG